MSQVSAIALMQDHVLRSKAWKSIREQCEAANILIQEYALSKHLADYKSLFQSNQNIITWGVKLSHQWMIQGGKNILFIENGLLKQSSGMFVDTMGYFSNSRISVGREFEMASPSPLRRTQEREKCCIRDIHCNPDGPILVVLQQELDASIQYYFPLALGKHMKHLFLLQLVRDFAPARKRILVRPHPREREASLFIGGEWELDSIGAFTDRLPDCSAIITVNSTCVSEAALTDIPIATFGTGAFSGSGISIECHQDPSRLRLLFDEKPDDVARNRYINTVLRHHIPYNQCDVENDEINRWIYRALHPSAGLFSKPVAIQAGIDPASSMLATSHSRLMRKRNPRRDGSHRRNPHGIVLTNQ